MKDKKPLRNPDIVVRKEENEALLFNPADGNMLCMNATGIFVWELCDGGIGVRQIAEKMASGYDVVADDAEKDCLSFVKEMEKSGFMVKPARRPPHEEK